MSDYNQCWARPPRELHLAASQVHVWRASLLASPQHIERLQSVLLDEERARARRFVFEKDRRAWTVARATLRLLLARYLHLEPQQLHFTTNAYGKPALSMPAGAQALRFNLSHSGDLALYACAYEREVGIDVEQMRAGIEHDELAAHFFSAAECAVLRALPPAQREEAFFLCWSRKEAYIKARGRGLSLPLDQFDVALVPGEPARLLESREDPGVSERWSLHALMPGERYAGALVVEGLDYALSCWQWPEEP